MGRNRGHESVGGICRSVLAAELHGDPPHRNDGKSSDFTAQFDTNTRLLRQVAGQLVETVILENCGRFSEDDVMRQVQAWQRDSLLQELRSIYRREQAINPVSQDWLLGPYPHSNSVDPTQHSCNEGLALRRRQCHGRKLQRGHAAATYRRTKDEHACRARHSPALGDRRNWLSLSGRRLHAGKLLAPAVQ